MAMIIYTNANTDKELLGIIDLQKANLPISISKEEALEQGFVTVQHTLDILQKMNAIEKHTIALDDEKVIGYVLAMTNVSKNDIPILEPMFELFQEISYLDKKVSEYNYMVVGQVCVSKDYRGMGVFDNLYHEYQKEFASKYDFAITEIALKNERSMKAHNRIGFKEIHRYTAPDLVEWSVVIWDWKK
ncbi:GNAT family N-acetyltransferase [Flavobacterium sp. H122]|uniref:GNAT family N-acetyltransferase n=1 Tax=Flavobacterium sp. H122 TaxID=2529860 RepID=UPI00145B1796|nr:GNAT family N-acetyltransferase [Flavobacterium sp. H122]